MPRIKRVVVCDGDQHVAGTVTKKLETEEDSASLGERAETTIDSRAENGLERGRPRPGALHRVASGTTQSAPCGSAPSARWTLAPSASSAGSPTNTPGRPRP